jgi:hypothetical protein
MAAEAHDDKPGGERDASAPRETLSSRIRDLLQRATVEERRKPNDGTHSGAERRRRDDPREPSASES